MVLVLSIKGGFYKIEKSTFRANNAKYEKMLRRKIVHLKKVYNFDFDHFLIKRTVFVLIVKNVIKNQKLNFSSAKREYRDENVFLKGDRALSKLITLLISNKKEFNHFFTSRRSDIVLLKVGNLFFVCRRVCPKNSIFDF